jgi:anti-anti-sigma factor
MDLEMDIETRQGQIPVTVVRPHGRIDGSTYESLIAQAKKLHDGGTRQLLLDLGDVSFLSSAGLVALHSIVLLMRGEELGSMENGWDALHDIERDASGVQSHVRLLNPQPKVFATLEKSGMDRFFMVFYDEALALASFL